MVALIVVAGALALLYFWLLGHWFARVLMALVLWPTFLTMWWLVVAAFMDGAPKEAGIFAAFAMIIGTGLSAVGAWKLSGYPIRWRIKAGYPVALWREEHGRPWFADFYDNLVRRR